jgi:hypothetical protein
LLIHPGTAALCFSLAYTGTATDTSEMGGCFFGKEKSGKPKVTGIKKSGEVAGFFSGYSG